MVNDDEARKIDEECRECIADADCDAHKVHAYNYTDCDANMKIVHISILDLTRIMCQPCSIHVVKETYPAQL